MEDFKDTNKNQINIKKITVTWGAPSISSMIKQLGLGSVLTTDIICVVSSNFFRNASTVRSSLDDEELVNSNEYANEPGIHFDHVITGMLSYDVGQSGFTETRSPTKQGNFHLGAACVVKFLKKFA